MGSGVQTEAQESRGGVVGTVWGHRDVLLTRLGPVPSRHPRRRGNGPSVGYDGMGGSVMCMVRGEVRPSRSVSINRGTVIPGRTHRSLSSTGDWGSRPFVRCSLRMSRWENRACH